MKTIGIALIISVIAAFGGSNNKVLVKMNGKPIKAFSKTLYEPPTSYESVPKEEVKRTELVSLEVLTPAEVEPGTDSLVVTLKGAYGKFILMEEIQKVPPGELVTFHGVQDAANQKFDRNGKKVLLERYIISISTLHKQKGDYLALVMLQ